MKLVKRLLIILAILILLVLVGAAIFTALNPKMVSNMANISNMRTDNVEEWETTRVAVPGRRDDSKLISAEASTLTADTLQQLRDYHLQTSGLSIAVWNNGEIILEEYSDTLTADSRTASFSMNKSITGLVAATLDAEGALSLDAPVSEVLEEWRNDDRGNITLRQLLQHVTPIEVVSMSKPDFRTLEILTGDDIETAALGIPLVEGEIGFDYATINYQVAGAVIRRYTKNVYDQTYPEYLSKKIWQPIGAGDAWISSGKDNGIPRFYAGMQASLRDWLKIGLLIKDNGMSGEQQIIPKAAIDTLIEPSAGNPLYGLGVWLNAPADGSREYGPSTSVAVPHKEPYLADDVIFFDGFGGQRVYVVPSADLVVVRTSQADFAYDDSVILNLVLADPAIASTQVAPQ